MLAQLAIIRPPRVGRQRAGLRLYQLRAAHHPDAPPAAGLVAAYLPTTLVMVNIWLGLVLLLTPSGSLPSPRWRWWARITLATLVALLVVVALATVVLGLLIAVVVVALTQDAFALAGLTGSLCLVILPAGIGAAILRDRPYDLDRIISRTLAYGC